MLRPNPPDHVADDVVEEVFEGHIPVRSGSYSYDQPFPAELASRLRERSTPEEDSAYVVEVSLYSAGGRKLDIDVHITRFSDGFLFTLLRCRDVTGIARWRVRAPLARALALV